MAKYMDSFKLIEDFFTWRSNVINTLERAGLQDHLLEEISEPVDDADKMKWKEDRVEANGYIQSSVPDDELWVTWKTLGWNITEDPKSTFDLVSLHLILQMPISAFL
ncbi:hypothetical protein B0I37DRAFT_369167 [Chaetomium sp. MPI-CAGE-AT-0009]|nr:hypothetical protein B0I37DRAFT_369167 [Chaetomium sp. MPI-CAGE-AT-0009]